MKFRIFRAEVVREKKGSSRAKGKKSANSALNVGNLGLTILLVLVEISLL